jgi:hypothetical protein
MDTNVNNNFAFVCRKHYVLSIFIDISYLQEVLTFALIFLNWENGDFLILMRYFIDISSLEGTYVIFW